MFLNEKMSFVIIYLGDHMKIIKFSKLKDNRYNVTLEDNEVLKLYDDVIIKYDLVRTKVINDSELDELVKYNDSLEAYYSAVKYITRKLRCECEIKKYLSKKYDNEIVNYTVDKLRSDGYLNKEFYLKCYIDDKFILTNEGPNKIKKELNKIGFEEEDIDKYLNEIDDKDWLDKLNKIIVKRININHRYSNNKLKEKLLYDLSNEGYYKWMIEDIIKKQEFKSDDNLVKKEYEKLYRKLSRKYDGSNLNYQIKQRLYQKGFNSSEIDNVFFEN